MLPVYTHDQQRIALTLFVVKKKNLEGHIGRAF